MICAHKAKLKTKRDARKMQGAMHNRYKGKKFHIYKCPECKNYHLSSTRAWKIKR